MSPADDFFEDYRGHYKLNMYQNTTKQPEKRNIILQQKLYTFVFFNNISKKIMLVVMFAKMLHWRS